MPQFYEIWAERAATDNEFWAEAAVASREFFPLAAHPETGLMPNYAQFDGSPQPRGDYGKYFYADAWRVPMNVAFE
jgi:oligosaccharide reducing-end xylanase